MTVIKNGSGYSVSFADDRATHYTFKYKKDAVKFENHCSLLNVKSKQERERVYRT